MSDLVGDFEEFSKKFCNLADCYAARFKDLSVDKDAELARYKEYAERVRPMVIETISFLHKELRDGKKVLVEGANAAMLDIDFGNLNFLYNFFY